MRFHAFVEKLAHTDEFGIALSKQHFYLLRKCFGVLIRINKFVRIFAEKLAECSVCDHRKRPRSKPLQDRFVHAARGTHVYDRCRATIKIRHFIVRLTPVHRYDIGEIFCDDVSTEFLLVVRRCRRTDNINYKLFTPRLFQNPRRIHEYMHILYRGYFSCVEKPDWFLENLWQYLFALTRK